MESVQKSRGSSHAAGHCEFRVIFTGDFVDLLSAHDPMIVYQRFPIAADFPSIKLSGLQDDDEAQVMKVRIDDS